MKQKKAGEKSMLKHLQMVLDLMEDSAITINVQGNIEVFDSSAERIFGYGAAEMIGQNFKMLMPTAYHSWHDDNLERCLTKSEAHVIGRRREVVGRRKDGSTFPMDIAISKIKSDHEPHFIGIVRDISRRNQAELQEAENQKELIDFKAALDQHAIVATTDADGLITYVNDKFCMISKYAREELIGQNHRIINSGYHPKTFFAELWATISNGHVWKGEIKNLAKDGAFYWVNTTIIPFIDRNGQPIQYIAIRTDITERKQIEMELISAHDTAHQANLAKDSFLATMSHEIRTPLGGMMGMLELLGYTPLNVDQRDTLQSAIDSGQSLLRIVNDILDWSKIEAGELGISPQPTSLTQILVDVVNTYARVASANSLILEQHIDTRLSQAHIVDPLRLSQVLNNFVSNALKFTQKGLVEVRADLLDSQDGTERVRFSVKDTGAGIKKGIQKRLFQSYQQADADTARRYGGTGLGLAICRKLADLMNGQLELESTLGMGSTFSITLDLPVSTTKAINPFKSLLPIETATSLYQDPSIIKADAPRVLVVDDHPINRKLMVLQLGLLGLQAETAGNGEEALAIWRNGQFDLIITDCHMPKMNGYELAQTLRQLEAGDATRPSTPIFAWTANALAEEEALCRTAGMNEVLVKPTNLKQLKNTLAKWELVTAASTHVGDKESGDLAPIDFSVLDKLSSDPEVKAEILRDFMAQTRSDYAELQAAEAHDLQAAQHIAHRMLGSSRMVGANELASVCAALEQSARLGDLESLDTVKLALQRLEAYLLKKETDNG
tara:strand:- start:104203 stop:106554 length:2352 start_codon:yes stop_codon:yes gene_type:complete